MSGQDPQAQAEAPVFLLGSGRCGSSFLQASLSRCADLWLWGEHDGILEGLFAWAAAARASPMLRQAAFPFAGLDPLTRQAEAEGGESWMLAWTNAFTPEDLAAIERAAVRRLFARGLPPGKRRWGFKEIRYLGAGGVGERLLELFPGARILHAVRAPIATIESSLAAWRGDLLLAPVPDDAAIRHEYQEQTRRWTAITESLLALEEARPERVMTIRIEEVGQRWPAIAAFLGLPAGELAAAAATAWRHEAGTAWPLDLAPLKEVLRKEAAPLVAPLAVRLGYPPPG